MNNHPCSRCNKPMCERSDNRPCSVCSLINSFIIVRAMTRARIAFVLSWRNELNDYSIEVYNEMDLRQRFKHAIIHHMVTHRPNGR